MSTGVCACMCVCHGSPWPSLRSSRRSTWNSPHTPPPPGGACSGHTSCAGWCTSPGDGAPPARTWLSTATTTPPMHRTTRHQTTSTTSLTPHRPLHTIMFLSALGITQSDQRQSHWLSLTTLPHPPSPPSPSNPHSQSHPIPHPPWCLQMFCLRPPPPHPQVSYRLQSNPKVTLPSDTKSQ